MRGLSLSSGFFAAALLAAPVAAMAQQGGGEVQRPTFEVYSSFVSAGFDDGMVVDGEPIDDLKLTLVPGALAYRNVGRRSSFELIYEPEFELFEERTDLNAWNQAAAGQYSRLLTRHLSLRVAGSFLSTEDRTGDSPGVAFSQRGPFMEGRLNGGMTYQINGETSVSFHADGAFTRSPVLGLDPELFVNEGTTALDATISRNLGATHSLSGSYGRVKSTILNPSDLPLEESPGDGPANHRLGIGYGISTSTGLSLDAGVGVLRLTRVLDEVEYSPSYQGRVEKRWSQWFVSGGYSRTLSGFRRLEETDVPQTSDPFLAGQVAQTLDIAFSGQFGRRVLLDYRSTLSRTSLGPEEEPLDSLLVAVVLGVDIGSRFEPFVTASFFDQTATEQTDQYSRTRVFAGLRFYWGSSGSSPNRRTLPSEPVRSILPVRRAQVQR